MHHYLLPVELCQAPNANEVRSNCGSRSRNETHMANSLRASVLQICRILGSCKKDIKPREATNEDSVALSAMSVSASRGISFDMGSSLSSLFNLLA